MENPETVGFKTDVKRVMDIIIRSLYQHEEVFLRELISNASDALNKVRVKTLTSEDVYQKDLELTIDLIPNSEAKTLTIKDTGIGMTRDELIKNLGTVAQSGTLEYLEKMGDQADADELIGHFGVGFYSAFLVANKVVVRSRSADPAASAYEWSSEGENTFIIQPCEKEDRGTEIILYFKEDAEKYLGEFEVRNVIQKYSDFVTFPIRWFKEEDDEEEEDESDKEDESDEEASDDSEETEPKGPTVLNKQKAIWRTDPKEISEEEYTEFYRHVSGKWDDPFLKIHIRATTPVEFFAILYVPRTKVNQFMTPDSEWGLKLYTKKVLIQERNKDLLPEYLRFMVGVVDSEDIPLNVSREVVQNSKLVNKIKRYLEKKILEELEKLAKDDVETYLQLYREYGMHFKEGIAQQAKHKDKLIELLRFHSTLDDVDGRTGAVSLADYFVRMKPEQEEIYYLTGHSLDIVKNSPHLEYYKQNELEVLLMGEPIDNFLMMNLHEYQEKKFFLIDQDESEDEPEPEKKDGEDEESEEEVPTGPHAELITKFKDVLGKKVAKVKTSDRLVNSPVRLVTPKGGMSSDFQRAMKYMENSPLGGLNTPGLSNKTLQINPEHEIIKKLEAKLDDAEYSAIIINQLFSNALIAEGELPDMSEVISRVEKIIEKSLE